MIEKMCDNYPNLMVDISWVVWEDVICDESGKVKKGWVDCIQKHHTRFFIGSDNVAQFFPIRDTSINLLASNITKYYQLFDQLTPEAAVNAIADVPESMMVLQPSSPAASSVCDDTGAGEVMLTQ